MEPWGDLRVIWRDSFLVGDEMIDAQHRAFFDETSQVLAALERGEGKEAVIAFYRGFVTSLAVHFADEEALLERTGYPQVDHHRAEHAALLRAVTAVEAMLVTGSSLHHLRLIIRQVFASLIDHLLSEDMRFKSHIQACSGR